MGLKEKIMKKAEESKILPHPLTNKGIDISIKNAYLGGVVLAALLDDAKIADEERKRIRELGLSLKMIDSDITETVGNVEALKSEDEREAFLEEIVPVLKNREVALFFLCDFAKTFGADGQYTQDDLDYCNAIAEWLGLDEKDMAFYKEYRNYLLPGKEMECAAFMIQYSDTAALPSFLYEYTCPAGIANQEKWNEQKIYFSKMFSLLENEIGCHLWNIDEDDLDKRSLEERELVQAFHDEYPNFSNMSISVGNLLEHGEYAEKIASWICKKMIQKYSSVNIESFCLSMLNDIKELSEENEIQKFDITVISKYDYGDSLEMFYSRRSADDLERDAIERFCRYFKPSRSERIFKEKCRSLARLYSGYFDFVHTDTRIGYSLFRLIILRKIFEITKSNAINYSVSFLPFPEVHFEAKTDSELVSILWENLEQPSWYDCYIKTDDLTKIVDLNPAFDEMEKHMDMAYKEIKSEYYEQAKNKKKVPCDYLKRQIVAFRTSRSNP